MDTTFFLSMIFPIITTILFTIYAFIKFYKNKTNSSFLLLLIALGLFFGYLFGYARTNFVDNPPVDSLFWRMSGISLGITLTAFLMLLIEWIHKPLKINLKIFTIIVVLYFITYLIFFLVFPAERVISPEGYTEWDPSTPIKTLVNISAIATLILSIISIIYGAKYKNLKPILFGVGTIITLIGLILDGFAVVQFFIYNRIIAMIGVFLMFYSSSLIKK